MTQVAHQLKTKKKKTDCDEERTELLCYSGGMPNVTTVALLSPYFLHYQAFLPQIIFIFAQKELRCHGKLLSWSHRERWQRFGHLFEIRVKSRAVSHDSHLAQGAQGSTAHINSRRCCRYTWEGLDFCGCCTGVSRTTEVQLTSHQISECSLFVILSTTRSSFCKVCTKRLSVTLKRVISFFLCSKEQLFYRPIREQTRDSTIHFARQSRRLGEYCLYCSDKESAVTGVQTSTTC